MKKVSLEVVKGIQAGRVYFTTMVAFKEAVELFEYIDEENHVEVLDRAQRKVSKSRIKKMSEYVRKKSSSYIFPSLTAELRTDFEFIPIAEDSNLGDLVFELEEGDKIGLNDGQHRLLSIKHIVENSVDFLEKNPEFINETFSITLFEFESTRLSQQRFSDINSTPSKVSGNLTVLYNDDDPISKITNSYFTKGIGKKIFHLIEIENSTVSRDKLFALKDFYQVNKKIFNHLGKIYDMPFVRIQGIINRYWDVILNNLSPLFLEENKYYLKQDTVLCHSITINAFSDLFIDFLDLLKDEEIISSKLDNISEKLNSNFKNLVNIDFSKNNETIKDICFHNGRVVKNSKVIKSYSVYIRGLLWGEIEKN